MIQAVLNFENLNFNSVSPVCHLSGRDFVRPPSIRRLRAKEDFEGWMLRISNLFSIGYENTLLKNKFLHICSIDTVCGVLKYHNGLNYS